MEMIFFRDLEGRKKYIYGGSISGQQIGLIERREALSVSQMEGKIEFLGWEGELTCGPEAIFRLFYLR